uniref:Uncharacterized protein n=1 Tax=Parascaris equorum TaxID=6256 RepID=A0A914RBS4_PAREQ
MSGRMVCSSMKSSLRVKYHIQVCGYFIKHFSIVVV